MSDERGENRVGEYSLLPIIYKKEVFRDGELISVKHTSAVDDTHWKAVIEEITRDPVAPFQYWILDNRKSLGTGSTFVTRFGVAKLIEAGAKEILLAVLTGDPAYQPLEIILNDIASTEGLPFAMRFFENRNDALDWLKNHNIQREGTLR